MSASDRDGDPPNVLFLVWDACRFDYAREEAETLRELGEENLWFENAIAPSTWSLPSHASLFTGEYPHEHGIHRASDSMDDVTLFDDLREQGYTLYGVSGNGFVSHSTNVHEFFDEFYYTAGQGPFLDGLTVYAHVFGQTDRDEDLSPVQATLDTVKTVATHDHPLKSLANFAAVGLNRVAANVPPLQRIPHPVCDPYQPYSYDPERNTRKLAEFFEREADSDDPFFAFANYMDTHRPYHPPKEYQEEILGETLSFGELSRLNQEVEDPWQFLTKLENDELDEDDVETVRDLYRGEVRSVDDHLERLLAKLEEQGLREDTLVIVTADHGENLGEVDEMGRRRMGHECSMSNQLLRVPLVIARPQLEGQKITEQVNNKCIFDLIAGDVPATNQQIVETLDSISPATHSIVEYPPVGGTDILGRYPAIPNKILKDRVDRHSVALYSDVGRLVLESTGKEYAWNEDGPCHPSDLQDQHLKAAEDHLAAFSGEGEVTREDSPDIERLEALGYI